MAGSDKQENRGLKAYLSPYGVWALSIGCAVGWGSFVMPGTTFLPIAGPIGTALGIGTGAVVMLIIGINYCYLMNRYPDAGGTLTYTTKSFGHDHGYLSSWFLILVYVAIIWANASALTLIGRNLLGSAFQFGFHYRFLGYDVYAGEVLLSISALLLVGLLCIYGKRPAVWLQTLFALVLCAGLIITFVFVVSKYGASPAFLKPAFAKGGKNPLRQLIGIIVLSPWAFAGFESVSHSVEEFKFPVKKTIVLIVIALVVSAAAYIVLACIAASVLPEGYSNWEAYMKDLSKLEGLKGLPTFYATGEAMGKTGLILLGFTVLAAILTGLIGNYIAASRLLYAMAKDDILPEWFGRLNKDGSPANAFLFLMAISMGIPFLGRTALGWIVDVNTIGATVAYGYTSAAAYATAKREGDRKISITGIAGFLFSLGFFGYFMVSSARELSTESYLILAVWSILGFVYFRHVFSKDSKKRFGRSTIVWIGLIFLIFFTSLMWVRRATDDMTTTVVNNISEYYEERNAIDDPNVIRDTENYISGQMARANRLLIRNSIIQMAMIIASLAIMVSIYSTMSRRERELEREKIKAEEVSRAKSSFLSNMSHDIRTPMNAIVGYINLGKKEDVTLEELRGYLNKIEGSSQYLLALINDVLEMSRIESGKMELEPTAADIGKMLDEVRDMFSTQMGEKNIDFSVDYSGVGNPLIYCDKNRMNRVLLNLLSNAWKFTPEGGKVTVTAVQTGENEEGFGHFEIRVADTGIGMSEEFAAKVFEAFERESTPEVSGVEGTGLGMSIVKNIVELMGGTIEVITARGKGTEFIIKISFELQGLEEEAQHQAEESGKVLIHTADFSTMKVLLVEDMAINREIALMLLKNLGFEADTALNGKEAVEKVRSAGAGYYNAVLMDIQMPVMDGYEATRQIRAFEDDSLSQIPIIAMTANAFSEDVKKALEVGMNAHIAKPIDVNAMENTLHEILG